LARLSWRKWLTLLHVYSIIWKPTPGNLSFLGTVNFFGDGASGTVAKATVDRVV